MSTTEIITTAQPDAWHDVLCRAGQYDTYHLPQYHALAEAAGEGTACLFAFRDGDHTIALPLLVRSLDQLEAVAEAGAGWFDATSVYGYSGPIGSHAVMPQVVIQAFQKSLHRALVDRRVISVFSRLHPLLSQEDLWTGLGECPTRQRTVSIDLTVPSEQQKARYRQNHREGIAKLMRKGLALVHDTEGVFFTAFQDIYYETMRRVGASSHYYFPSEYFMRLREGLGEHAHLFAVVHEERAVCAAIVFECHGMVQYHLGGTLDAARKLAPMKLLLDGVRAWATTRGSRVLHLGGGATGRPDDPLLHFKAGFSDRLHDFRTWCWIVVPEVYRRLCAVKNDWNDQHDLCESQADFFPAYRCPTKPRVAAADAGILMEAQA